MTCAKSFAGAARARRFSPISSVRADTAMILTRFVETAGNGWAALQTANEEVASGEERGTVGFWGFVKLGRDGRIWTGDRGRAGPGKTLSFHFVSARHGPLPRSDSALDTILRTLEPAREERALAVTRELEGAFPCVLASTCVRTCVRESPPPPPPRYVPAYATSCASLAASRDGLSLRVGSWWNIGTERYNCGMTVFPRGRVRAAAQVGLGHYLSALNCCPWQYWKFEGSCESKMKNTTSSTLTDCISQIPAISGREWKKKVSQLHATFLWELLIAIQFAAKVTSGLANRFI